MDRTEGTSGQGASTGRERIVTGTGDPTAATTVQRSAGASSAASTSPQQTTGDQAGQQAQQAGQKAGQMIDQAQQQAGQLADQAKQQARPRLEHQKDQAAGQLTGVAKALRQTGQTLRQQNQGGVAQLAEQGAEQIDRFSDYLQHHDLNDLVRETEQFARRQPALFVGGAFALGLLGARFLKSSGQQAGATDGSHSGHYAGATNGSRSGQYAGATSSRS